MRRGQDGVLLDCYDSIRIGNKKHINLGDKIYPPSIGNRNPPTICHLESISYINLIKACSEFSVDYDVSNWDLIGHLL